MKIFFEGEEFEEFKPIWSEGEWGEGSGKGRGGGRYVLQFLNGSVLLQNTISMISVLLRSLILALSNAKNFGNKAPWKQPERNNSFRY